MVCGHRSVNRECHRIWCYVGDPLSAIAHSLSLLVCWFCRVPNTICAFATVRFAGSCRECHAVAYTHQHQGYGCISVGHVDLNTSTSIFATHMQQRLKAAARNDCCIANLMHVTLRLPILTRRFSLGELSVETGTLVGGPYSQPFIVGRAAAHAYSVCPSSCCCNGMTKGDWDRHDNSQMQPHIHVT